MDHMRNMAVKEYSLRPQFIEKGIQIPLNPRIIRRELEFDAAGEDIYLFLPT